MVKADRTVKILLGLIAFFLGILALRPVLQIATSSWAQTATPTPTTGSWSGGDGLVSVGSQVIDVANVAAEGGKPIRGVYVMDNSHSFIVQYDDHLHVYGVRDVRIRPGTLITPVATPIMLIDRAPVP